DVLLGADLEHCRPWIMVIEATAPNSQVQTHSAWEELLIAASYRFCWFDGLNRFYIASERWEELSPAFTVPPNIVDDFIRAADVEHLNKIISAEADAANAARSAEAANSRAADAIADAGRRVLQAESAVADANRLAEEADASASAARCRAEAAATL